jgi:zona occludens toxin
MIYFYSGTPGSGKSLHVARDIYYRLNRNKKYPNVIANFMINEKMIKNKKANFIYKDNSDLTVSFLLNYAFENHKQGLENQTLVVVDEASVIWNAREWQKGETSHNRMDWLKFFVQHRKLGYNFIIISQTDRQIDRQIRSLFEYEIKHRKVNNFKIGKLLPFPMFACVSYWYGVNERLGVEFFTYRRKWGKFYDSYGTFELDSKLMDLAKKEG